METHRHPWRATDTHGDLWRLPIESHRDLQRPVETCGDPWRPVESTHRDSQRPAETTRGDHLQRPAETTHGDHPRDPWRHLEFDWLIFPSIFNDIIGSDFDWLIFPTTTRGDPRRPTETTHGDPWRPPAKTHEPSRIWLVYIPHHIQWHHWHRFWLVNIPTTANQIIGIEQPN